MKRLKQAMSAVEKAKRREEEATERKRLRIEKIILPIMSPEYDFNCMTEAKNIYTELKILLFLTNINPLCVSFVIDLSLVQRQFTVCRRKILVLMS
jgi:hypothetical protein